MSIKLSGASGGGGAPSGSAGGDLSGTYPNPDVATVAASTAANVHTAELLANAATASGTNSTVMKRSASGGFAAIGTSFVLDATTGLSVDLPDATVPPPVLIKSGDATSNGNGADTTIQAGLGDGGASVGGSVILQGGATNGFGGVVMKSGAASGSQVRVLPDSVNILAGPPASNNDLHLAAGTTAGRVFITAGYPSGSILFATGVNAGEIDPDGNLGMAGSVGVGVGLQVAEGSDARMGLSALSSGSVVVSNTSVTANTRIFLTSNVDGGVGPIGALRVSARTPGTSFTITSSVGTDASSVAWLLMEPFA